MEPKSTSGLNRQRDEFNAKLIDPIILAFAILGLPLLFGSLYRLVITGWKWIYLIHILMTIVMWNLQFFKKKIGSNYKVSIVNLLIILIACLGLYNFGILGYGKMLLIVSVVFTGIFVGRKQAYVLLVATFVIFVTFAFLFLSNRLHYNFDVENYINQPSVWITAIVTLMTIITGLQIINEKYIEFFISSEKKTRESEEKFRNIFNNSGDVMVIADFNLKILDVNQTALRTFGLAKEKMIGEKIIQFLQDTYQNIIIDRVEKLKTQDVSPVELEIITGNKVSIPVEINSTKIDYEGKEAVLSILRDITERKKASQELVKSEERFRTLASNIPGAVYRCNAEFPWHMEYISDNILDITGQSASEFMDKKIKFGDLIHKEDLENVKIEVNDALNEQRPFRLEYRIEHADGKVRWVMERGQAEYSEPGTPLWLDGVIFDVTENKKAQQALQESEERYRIIADASPVGITTVDLEGKITFASQRIAEMHGFNDRDEILALNAVDLVAGSDRNLVVQSFQSTVEKGIVRDIECKLRKNDGTDFYGEVSAAVLRDVEKKPIGYLAITKDITDRIITRKKLEERLFLEKTLSEFSAKFVNLPAEKIYDEISKGFEYIGKTMDFDRILLWELSEDMKKVTVSSGWTKEGMQNLPLTFDSDIFPNIIPDLIKREVVTFSLDIENSGYAVSELDYFQKFGIKSSTIIPVYLKEKNFGAISFSSTEIYTNLSDEQISYLILIGNVLSYVLQRRETELAFRESNIRFQLLIENIPAVTWVTSQEGITSYISPNIEKVYGYTQDEIYKGGSELWFNRIHPEDSNRVIKGYEELFNENKTFNIEYRIKRKDGKWIWLHDRANLFHEYGGISYAYGVFADITHEKQAEFDILLKNQELQSAEEEIRANLEKLEDINAELEEKNEDLTKVLLKLEENERKYRTLYENANDGIFIMKNEVFIMCNPKTLEIFKTDSDNIVGRTPVDFSPEFQPYGIKSKDKANDLINRALNDQPQHFEWLHKRSGGDTFFAEVSLNKLMIGDEVYLQAILRDISEKKQMERKILNAIIETEEKERGRFAMELHDGLGPLFSTIKLYTQSVQAENNPEERKAVLKLIHDSVDEAISSLREISNNISPHILQNFGLNSAVNSFIEKIQRTKKINISFNSNTNERYPEIIETTIYRVLIELINNTMKHARAKNITIRMKESKNILNVIYNDDGIGIDTDGTSATKGGMGIFNIHNRIKSLNGYIVIESKKNKGMKVHILLNLNEIGSVNN